ncbi:CEAM1-like protein [Mya arenaria]|uniref:CEAM1-like protein n=1 Tax=Mya arenaria TaxID=6604 RepID=A0ABY7EU29_MYAAR|nr:CEAM1-like protein [Mya arenaria]
MDITYLLSVLFMVHTEIKPVEYQRRYYGGAGKQHVSADVHQQWLDKRSNSRLCNAFVKRFMLDNPTTTVTFHSIECSDDGTYTWDGSYYAIESGQTSIATRQAIVVKVYPIFGPEDSQLTYSPTANLTEGDKVKFTCSGDVGNNPVDILAWFYYRNGEVAPTDESSDAVLTAPQVTRVCSRSRSSTIELTLTRDMDNTVVRCTVQQDIRTAEGEGHIDTNALSVTCKFLLDKPVIRSLIRYPDMQLYPERLEELQLRCYAEGNPLPGHFWLFNNSTRAGYGSLVLNNLTTAQEGTYTCVAYNYIKGVINNVSASTYIAIQQQQYKKTELIASSEGSTAFTGIHNYENLICKELFRAGCHRLIGLRN